MKRGIGYSGDDHHTGKALDVAPPKSISSTPGGIKKMDDFAAWAVASGKYTKVIYKGKNMMTGTKVEGHNDHVHLSWD